MQKLTKQEFGEIEHYGEYIIEHKNGEIGLSQYKKAIINNTMVIVYSDEQEAFNYIRVHASKEGVYPRVWRLIDGIYEELAFEYSDNVLDKPYPIDAFRCWKCKARYFEKINDRTYKCQICGKFSSLSVVE